jgi:hypothetical protein
MSLGRKSATKSANLPQGFFQRTIGQRISDEELLFAYIHEPCTRKAISKQASDTFERWFEIRPVEGEELPEKVEEIVWDLIDRTDMKQTLMRILKRSMIFGTGYLELVLDGDNSEADEEPSGNQIADLVLVENVAPIVDNKIGSETHGEILHYEQRIIGNPAKIHKDRIIHFPFDQVGTDPRGIGLVKTVYQLVRSKIIVDKLCGKIPESVIKQIVDLKIAGANLKELKDGYKKLKEAQEALRFVGTEKHTFQVHDAGRGLDIEPFTEHLVQQLSTGLGMPKQIMTGAEAGKLATAEINLKDYYSDIRNLQERFTPIVKRIIDLELELQGINDVDYEIVWNPLYTNDEKESEILLNKARAANQLVEFGILSTDEIREIFFGLEPRESAPEGRKEGPGDNYVS